MKLGYDTVSKHVLIKKKFSINYWFFSFIKLEFEILFKVKRRPTMLSADHDAYDN